MRSRDIKKTLQTPRQLEAQFGPEEARRIEAQCKALGRIRARQAAQQRRQLANPDKELPAPPEGLKRGPKPNPFLDKCEHGLHTSLTKREKQAFEALRKAKAPHVTPSTFLRFVICEALEKHRRKDLPTSPFTVDLDAVQDVRRLRGSAGQPAQRAAC